MEYNDSRLAATGMYMDSFRAHDDAGNPAFALRVGKDPSHLGMPVWLDRDAVKELVAEGQQFLDDTAPKVPTAAHSVIEVHIRETDGDEWLRLSLLEDAACRSQWLSGHGQRYLPEGWDDWRLIFDAGTES